jgi:serine phosphatase RsbU (regulator of sigma subunit)
MHRQLLSFFLFLLPFALPAQDPYGPVNTRKVDSLLKVLEKTVPDTDRAEVMGAIGREYMDREPAVAFGYARQVEKIGEQYNDRSLLAQAWYIIGNCYVALQSYTEALEYFYKALPIREEENNKYSLARLYNQIGIIYAYQKDHKNSLKYFLKFADMARQLNDSDLLANVYNNIGVTYKNLGKRDIASEYYYKALRIFTARDFKRGIASAYTNIATILNSDGEWDASIAYNEKALALFRSLGLTYGMTTTYVNLAETWSNKKDFKVAAAYYDSALTVSREKNDRLHLRDIYDGLYKLYAQTNDHERAFEYLLKYMTLKDSLFNVETASRTAGLEAKYKMEQAEKEMRQKEEISALKNKQQKVWIGLLVIAVLLVAVIALFVFSRYRQKQRANEMLEEHNAMVEHQKKEITDSINYAKKIQMSILPPDGLVKRLLPDSFVLYKPKDIVSGDFYWVDECDGQVLFASVDCTGHGVPGAMMSVLGFNLLSGAVNEKRLTTPSRILEHLDFGVDKMLRQSTDENSVRDGMDLSLCSLNYKTGLLQFAGAYNGLWMVKAKNREFAEIKADKMMIGVNAGGQADHFTNHEIQLEKGDVVYIFSDGYADQFGGPSGKKLKYKPMKELLLSIFDKPMAEQRRILDEHVEKWRGDLEQVDDILVIGVRY